MKHLSLNQLATIVVTKRQKKYLSQAQLSEQTGIHRTMIGCIERGDYMPTIPQLEKLAEVLEFLPEELWQEDENDQIKKNTSKITKKTYKIAVAGMGYVGLSIATLLSQHHEVTAVDIVPEKVEMLNKRIVSAQ